MTEQSIPDAASCRLRTGRNILPTGALSASESANGPDTAVKAAPLIPTAEPETASLIPLPAAASSLPSPTSTTIPLTAIQPISEPGASAAISPMTPSTMPEPENTVLVLSATTDSPRCSAGKTDKPQKLNRKQLQKAIADQPEDLLVCQLTAESYRPAMDSIRAAIVVWGSNSKFPLYGVINKQVAAKCQMNGINDPAATRRQRIALLTMFEDVYDVHTRSIELGLDKERMEQWRNEQLTKTALFHGFGSKKDRKLVEKTRKAA